MTLSAPQSTIVSKGAGAITPLQVPVPPIPQNAWQTAGGSKAWKSAMATAKSRGLRQSVTMMALTTTSSVANRIGNLQVGGQAASSWKPTAKVYEPSCGPSRSIMATNFHPTVAPSRATARTARQAFTNAVCNTQGTTSAFGM